MKLTISLILLSFASTILAHDLSIKSSEFVLEKPGDITLTMILQREEIHWLWQDYEEFKMIGPGGETPLTSPPSVDPVIPLKQEGTYVIGCQIRPDYIEIDAAGFNRYLQMEGYRRAMATRKESGKENEAGRERYSRYLKAFLQVGSRRTEDFNKIFGQKIEIIPLTNPYSLTVDSELDVKVLFDGKPLANEKIMATYEGYSTDPIDYAETGRTNEEGIAAFQITHPGVWMVRISYMLPLKDDPKADWESFWANCSFVVPENRKH